MADTAEAKLTVPSAELDVAVDAIAALCDGDQRAALRALVAANDYLNSEVERLQAMISNGYARGRTANRRGTEQAQNPNCWPEQRQ